MDCYKAILINVPVELFKRLNQASVALALNRSELIRQVLTRDINFVFEREIDRCGTAVSAARFAVA
jgi:metal-responsive CopG/Arc/MetJ family transcriptional regulator